MNSNYLLGKGELLAKDIKGPRINPQKSSVYTVWEAKKRLVPMIDETVNELNSLPSKACPRDYTVAKLILNPSYIAKSYFPSVLLESANLISVGSKNVRIMPERWGRKPPVEECSTTQLFIAGKKSAFRNLSNMVKSLDINSEEAQQLTHVERFASYAPGERIKRYGSPKQEYFEVGLQGMVIDDESIILSFKEFADDLKVKLYSDLEFQAGGLWFAPVKANWAQIERLAQFAFVRVVRPVPRLRSLRPVTRVPGLSLKCQLPDVLPLSDEPRVAILDGGLPESHHLGAWIKSYNEIDSEVEHDPDGPSHGLAVTSAYLFGPLTPNKMADRPYTYVDHHRVLDAESALEPELEMYRTLGFIEEILLSRQYEFVNLSLGPALPVEDDEVHPWTSVIDEILSDGKTFMTIAVGNNGESDWDSGNARVQVPADCVNAICVGASNKKGDDWQRAPYSAVGPGRSPGVVKPDLVAFGGSSEEYFHALCEGDKPLLQPNLGTSLAGPYLLRSAAGIKAILGSSITALTVKALMVHTASDNGLDRREVGWGRIAEDIFDISATPDGVVRVIYQGDLKSSKYLRAPLPLEGLTVTGMINIKATFCYASPIDPQDANAYTKAGLEVRFRPNDKKMGKSHPKSKSFFQAKDYANEHELRASGKWETVLHGQQRMQGRTLSNPAFDIHYIAREGTAALRGTNKIPYSLVITLEAPKHVTLYQDILNLYSEILTPIRPKIQLPIQV